MENSREDEKDRREEQRARLRDLWETMGPDGYFTEFIKRPTQTQVKECVAELDSKGRWDEETPGELLDLLLQRYPELRKAAKAPRAAKSIKKQPAGCLGMIVFLAVMALFSIACKIA
jgi:hypothetical protein